MTSKKKMSKAEMRRLATEANVRYQPRELPSELQRMLETYAPQSVDAVTYQQIKPVVIAVMQRTTTTGKEKFRQQRGYITQLAAWSLHHGLSLEIEQLLTVGRIQEYVNRACTDLTDATRADKRSDLLELAQQVNPDYDGIPRAEPIARPSVKPPYTDSDVGNIVRVARNQNTAGRRRQMCAIVGLGLGAGLGSTDLKPLRCCDVEDHGEDGIVIHATGRRPRVIPVRRQFEALVREGLEGLRPGDLVIGQKADRKDVANRVVAQAVIPSTAPHIEQSRLRATYLAALIQQPIPLLDLLEVAGIKSVQTLVDTAKHLREQQEAAR